ncbi:MAG: glycerol-3-phosphate dehydrogenase/oxidase [Rubrobacteraceae bacterium]
MWEPGWRETVLEAATTTEWDLVVIGGGITGAGILRESVRQGLKTLLVEGRDFAWGTSSRSSKLVHGGIRYLRQRRFGLTARAVRERERLVREAPGLVDRLGFLLAVYAHQDRAVYGFGLNFYDLIARHRGHKYHSAHDFGFYAPHLSREGLLGGFSYADASTDDARMVTRLLREAVGSGGSAVNYAPVRSLLRDGDSLRGVAVADAETGREYEIASKMVVNATGAFTDSLRSEVGGEPMMRPLRGSHLVFPRRRLPVAQAVSFKHAAGASEIFAYPWEGATIVGTTDIDHDRSLSEEPRASAAETEYMVAALRHRFPTLDLGQHEAVSSWAGVRPVVRRKALDPSKESREDLIVEEGGLLSVTGGKLTTFRLTAHEVLARVLEKLGLPATVNSRSRARSRIFDDPLARTGDASETFASQPSFDEVLGRESVVRLLGRHGREARALIYAAEPGELTPIPGTYTPWAELRWAARCEGVVHLDDLLLRRTRIGVVLPRGGEALLGRVRSICQPELGWSDDRWEAERAAYLKTWEQSYAVPGVIKEALEETGKTVHQTHPAIIR